MLTFARLRFRAGLALVLGWFLHGGPARACPDCALGREVRASVFDERFWPSLAAVTLPIVVVAAVSAGLYRVGRRGTTGRPTCTEER